MRIVDEAEIQQLNQQYRGKDKTTNVLSFPFEMPEFSFPDVLPDDAQIDKSMPDFLGDIVICAQVVEQESKQQNKLLQSPLGTYVDTRHLAFIRL